MALRSKEEGKRMNLKQLILKQRIDRFSKEFVKLQEKHNLTLDYDCGQIVVSPIDERYGTIHLDESDYYDESTNPNTTFKDIGTSNESKSIQRTVIQTHA